MPAQQRGARARAQSRYPLPAGWLRTAPPSSGCRWDSRLDERSSRFYDTRLPPAYVPATALCRLYAWVPPSALAPHDVCVAERRSLLTYLLTYHSGKIPQHHEMWPCFELPASGGNRTGRERDRGEFNKPPP